MAALRLFTLPCFFCVACCGRRILALLLLLLLLLLVIQNVPATAAGVESGQTYRIVGNNAIPPIIHSKNQKAAGLAVDLIDAVAEKAKLTIQVEAMHWPDAQAQVLDGKADALLHINVSPEREQLYDFSEPLLAASFHLFRLSTRPTIQDLASLQRGKVGVEAGGFPEHFLRQHEQYSASSFPTGKPVLTSLPPVNWMPFWSTVGSANTNFRCATSAEW